MKARLLLGVAALVAPMFFATQAQALGCSDVLTEALNPRTTLPRLQELGRLAWREGCPVADRNRIDAQITQRQTANGATPERATLTVQAVTALIDPGARAAAAADAPPPRATEQPRPASAPQQPETRPPPAEEPAATEIAAPPPPPRPLEPITLDRPVTGARLEAGEELGSLNYDQYQIHLDANQAVDIAVRADDFQPIAAIGTGQAPDSFYDMADSFPETEDDREANLRFVAPEAGDYTIIAASSGQYGTYGISVSTFVIPPPPPPTPVALDSAVTGTINADSPVLYSENGVSYALYSIRARAGEQLQISMVSTAAADGSHIDPYLVIGRQGADGFEEVQCTPDATPEDEPQCRNDDRGDGTLNSLVSFTPDRDGVYLVRARTYSAGQQGDYRLSVDRVATLAAPRQVSERGGTWARQGEISVESPVLASTANTNLPLRYVSYEFRPRAGRSYRVHAYSSSDEFVPIVDVVQPNGGAVDVFDKGASSRDPNNVVFEAGRGSYIVRVSAQPSQTGSFDLVVSEVTE